MVHRRRRSNVAVGRRAKPPLTPGLPCCEASDAQRSHGGHVLDPVFVVPLDSPDSALRLRRTGTTQFLPLRRARYLYTRGSDARDPYGAAERPSYSCMIAATPIGIGLARQSRFSFRGGSGISVRRGRRIRWRMQRACQCPRRPNANSDPIFHRPPSGHVGGCVLWRGIRRRRRSQPAPGRLPESPHDTPIPYGRCSIGVQLKGTFRCTVRAVNAPLMSRQVSGIPLPPSRVGAVARMHTALV